MKGPQPVSFARLIVAKLEYVGPTDKLTLKWSRYYSVLPLVVKGPGGPYGP